jgi:saccharopine dehydrogenase-like NADP-dependent oxidoreductase
VSVADTDVQRRDAVVSSSGSKAVAAEADSAADVVVLAGPCGTQVPSAQLHLAAGRPVVATSDAIDDVHGLLELDAEARARGVAVVIGATFSPGYSCLLARQAAAELDQVTEVHVARSGTGGPACARQHHAALTGQALDWRDGGWSRRSAGSGRELCFFPDPVGAVDCYRAELPDSLLLVRAFPALDRVTARLAATRRDRFSAHLPMLRKPHPEGLVGAVRVEVRGRRQGMSHTIVLGVLDRPAVASGAVAALAARAAVDGNAAPGAGGLAALADPRPLLLGLIDVGVKAAVFDGSTATT